MSTRQGEFVSLREVLDEVGSDATRYILLTRRPDAPLEFDLEFAKKQSDENPVYYVQYATRGFAASSGWPRNGGLISTSSTTRTSVC